MQEHNITSMLESIPMTPCNMILFSIPQHENDLWICMKDVQFSFFCCVGTSVLFTSRNLHLLRNSYIIIKKFCQPSNCQRESMTSFSQFCWKRLWLSSMWSWNMCFKFLLFRRLTLCRKRCGGGGKSQREMCVCLGLVQGFISYILTAQGASHCIKRKMIQCSRPLLDCSYWTVNLGNKES